MGRGLMPEVEGVGACSYGLRVGCSDTGIFISVGVAYQAVLSGILTVF